MDLNSAARSLAAAFPGSALVADGDAADACNTGMAAPPDPPPIGRWRLVAHASEGRRLISCSNQSRLVHHSQLASYGIC